MKTMLKVFAVSCLVALTSVWPAANAEVISDFEGGAADYDNASPQTTGLFRDTLSNSYIDLTDNGAGNDYLVLAGKTSGSAESFVHDTTAGNADPYTLFYVPVGMTRTISADVKFNEYLTSVAALGVGLGIYDPSRTDGSQGFLIQYANRGVKTDPWSRDAAFARFLDSEDSATGTTLYGGNGFIYFDTAENVANPIVRMSVGVTNNGDGATIVFDSYMLDALEGNVTGSIWSKTHEFDYGTGDGELNMDLANDGFEICVYRGAGNGSDAYFDNLTITPIPEPSTLALLSAGLIGLLAYAWKKRK